MNTAVEHFLTDAAANRNGRERAGDRRPVELAVGDGRGRQLLEGRVLERGRLRRDRALAVELLGQPDLDDVSPRGTERPRVLAERPLESEDPDARPPTHLGQV